MSILYPSRSKQKENYLHQVKLSYYESLSWNEGPKSVSLRRGQQRKGGQLSGIRNPMFTKKLKLNHLRINTPGIVLEILVDWLSHQDLQGGSLGACREHTMLKGRGERGWHDVTGKVVGWEGGRHRWGVQLSAYPVLHGFHSRDWGLTMGEDARE